MKQRQTNTLDRSGIRTLGDHLRGDGRAAFLQTNTGRTYLGLIEADLRVLLSEPEAPAPGVAPESPQAEALKAHTDLGRTIWHGLTMVAAAPALPAETRAAAARVRDAFGARPLAPQAKAVIRVERASRVRHAMQSRQDDLALLPPVLDGETFAAWIARWCEMGTAFREGLLEASAAELRDVPARESMRATIGRLNGLFVRARRSLRDELKADPSLPRMLEVDLFGLFDHLLEERRARMAARRRAAAKGGQPPPPVEPAANDPAPAEPAPAEPAPVTA
jgi:hypothetical protein